MWVVHQIQCPLSSNVRVTSPWLAKSLDGVAMYCQGSYSLMAFVNTKPFMPLTCKPFARLIPNFAFHYRLVAATPKIVPFALQIILKLFFCWQFQEKLFILSRISNKLSGKNEVTYYSGLYLTVHRYCRGVRVSVKLSKMYYNICLKWKGIEWMRYANRIFYMPAQHRIYFSANDSKKYITRE